MKEYITLLIQRHARIFCGGCSYRATLAKPLSSFASVAQHHLFRKENILLDITIERNFLRQYRWISFRGENSNMFFSVSDMSVEFMSTFKNRHDLPKIGEGKSHCLVTNELRKENSHKDRVSPISDGANSFAETQTNFRIAKMALGL